MKPRVFVSSTYFDLKHVRERLERFIENYYFEPVLFESDNVLFEHNKPIDISCYNEVKLCHMMILIIGGRYGSIISGDNLIEKKLAYNNDYVSITRKEYETATKLNIPVFVFIDRNVYAEYNTYNKNQAFFEKGNDHFSFAHVDDINIFKFISSIKGIAIKTFEKIDDIENYIGNQIAGMLYLYLQDLQNEKQDEKILDSVSELKSISKRMNEMLLQVGKTVIQDTQFQDVIFNQNKIVIQFFVEQLIDNISFKNEIDLNDEELKEVLIICEKTIFNIENIQDIEKEVNWEQKHYKRNLVEENLKDSLTKLNNQLKIDSFNFFKIYNSYAKKVYPIISNNKELKEYFDSLLKHELHTEIYGLPF